MRQRQTQIAIAGIAAVVLAIVAVVWVAGSRAPAVAVATPEPSESPTPAPSPNLWRLDGVVVDEEGKPVEGVCVGLGPAICTDVNPRTDAKGRWYIDLPKAVVDYDFHFTKPGFQQFDMRARVVTPQTFRIRLLR